MYLVRKFIESIFLIIIFPFQFIARKFFLWNWKVYECFILLNMLWWMILIFIGLVTIGYLIVQIAK